MSDTSTMLVYIKGREELLSEVDGKVVDTYHFGDHTVARVEDADNIEEIEQISGVENVESDTTFHPRWNLGGISTQTRDVATIEDVRDLHNVPQSGGSGTGVTVAVMDSGIDLGHPVFEGMNIEQYDMTGRGDGDEVGHGTAVAGQIHRLAPDAELLSVRIFGDNGTTGSDVIMSAYEWLYNHTDMYDIVNMSWGASKRVSSIERVHKRLIGKDIHDVVASGNTGSDGGSPATAPGAFSVGACTKGGEMASFSSADPNLDNPELAAIGKNNRLAQATGTSMGRQLDGEWVMASGTSFAAPEVAGMIAKAGNPDGFVEKLVDNSDDLDGTRKDGAGLANYTRQVEKEKRAQATTWGFAGKDVTYINADWLPNGKHDARLRDDGIVEIIPDRKT